MSNYGAIPNLIYSDANAAVSFLKKVRSTRSTHYFLKDST